MVTSSQHLEWLLISLGSARKQLSISIVKELLDRKISQLDIEIQQLVESKRTLEEHRDRWSDYPTDIPNREHVCSLIDELISLENSSSIK